MLVSLFRRCHTRAAVARAEGVEPKTVNGWVRRLAELGFSDPRLAAGPGVSKPRAPISKLGAALRRDPAKVRAQLREQIRPRRGEGARAARRRAGELWGVDEITIRRTAEKLGLSRRG